MHCLHATILLVFLSTLEMRAPFLVFRPAVIAPALLGGLVPGLIVTIFSAFLVDISGLNPLGASVFITLRIC